MLHQFTSKFKNEKYLKKDKEYYIRMNREETETKIKIKKHSDIDLKVIEKEQTEDYARSLESLLSVKNVSN